MAKGCGVNIASFNNYRGGRSLPGSEQLYNIADYFHVSIDYLFGRCELDTEEYEADCADIVRSSYRKYLLTSRRVPKYVSLKIEDTIAYPVWPYNLLDAIFTTKMDPDQDVIDYPLTPNQLEGFCYVFERYLTEREKVCINLYFKDERSLEECGKHLNVGKERVRQIIAKAIRKLRHPSRSNIIRYGTDVLEHNKKQDEIRRLNSELDLKILELSKRKEELDNAGEITQEDIEDALTDVYCMPIGDLELSVRSYNCLTRAGCLTTADVIDKIEDDSIIRIRNLGRRSAAEIATRLMEIGYSSEKCSALAALIKRSQRCTTG